MPVLPDPLDRSSLRTRVQAVVDAEIAHQRTVLAPVGADLDPLVDAVASLLVGGKRLRAGFLYWGYRLAGRPDSDALVRMATAMELFQAAALLHDDVMDRSDTRRGRPTAHRALAARHRDAGWSGPSDRFGEGGAILAGDLCLQWTDELVATCGLPAADVARARTTFDTMRTQLMGGQYLDLLESARGWDGLGLEERVASVRRVVRYKSAKYTIEHPLLIGATAGGLPQPVLDELSRYGLALGEAFQLRDDVLGVFGDPERTGKPAGDDLREGKRTCSSPTRSTGPTPTRPLSSTSCSAAPTSMTPAWPTCATSCATPAPSTSSRARSPRWPRRPPRSSTACAATPTSTPLDLDPESLEVLAELVAVCTARDT